MASGSPAGKTDGWQCATLCECGKHPKWVPAVGPTFGRRVVFGISRLGDFGATSPGAWVVASCPAGVKETGREPEPRLVPPGTVVLRLPALEKGP